MQSNTALPASGKTRAHGPVLARTSRLIRRVFLMGSTALAGVPMVGLLSDAAANPQGGVVIGGAITINQASPTQLDVVQQSQRGIIDWRSFSIGANETTNFIQPLGGVTLNRVVGDQASQIFGRLTATGTIFLVNQNGIVFGQGAQVDVGGLIATTANISNNNFMAGLFKFDQASPLRSASVINLGDISVRDAGLAAFVAPGVENAGVIEAKLGRVLLGGAETFAVDLAGDGLLSFSLGAPVQARPVNASGQPMEALATNSGTIKAEGGSVMIAARQAVKVVENVVNMSGRIEATSVEMRGGTVVLSGGDTGRVAVSGQIDASGKDAGEKGGSVQVLGDVVALQAGSSVDVSGDIGGGTALIGGDWQGGGSTQRATTTTVATGASIAADAGISGDGGTVVVWADRDTRFDGKISARGGATSGNGGKVETSGKRDLLVGNNAKVDATAPKGTNGKWLLDPLNVIIGSVTTAGFLDGGDPNTFVPTATGATVSASAILAALNAGVDVEVTTGTTGAEAGNITVATALSWGSARQLKLSAAGAIDIQAPISAAAGALAMEALGGSVTQAAGGTLNVDRLSVKSAGAITLNQANNVNTLQLLSGNDDVVLVDIAGGLVAVGDIYSCFGTATVSTNGNLTAGRVLGQVASLTASGGSITLTDDVQSPMGTLTLSASGNITQTGGVITIRTLTGSAGGTTALNSANLITNLSTFASTGGLGITNAQALTVTGAVSSSGTVALTATTGNIINTLTTGTISGNNVVLTATAGSVQVVEDITATNAISLIGATGVSQNSSGILTAAGLYAETAASVNLQQANLVGSVAGKVTAGSGSFLFSNNNSFAVSTVAGNNGISINGGTVRLTAFAGTLSTLQPVNAGGGLIDLVANNMAIGSTLTSTGGATNQVTLRPVSGVVIDLGGADTSSRLGITNTEANNVFANVLQIGTTSGSNIEVTAPITLTSTPNLYLATAGTVVQSTGAALVVSGLRLDVTRNAPSILSDLNDVDRLAGQQTSNCFSSFCSATFSFTDIDGFAVDTVAGSNGLFYSTFAAVTLQATTGAITVTQQIQGGQNLTLIADAMAINNTVSGTNNMTLRPVTAGVTVNLGGADAPGVLGLDATELTRFSTPNLIIGTNAAGPIIVSSAVTISGSVSNSLTLQTLDDITFAANFTRTGGGFLQLTADEITVNTGVVVDTARGLGINARNLTLVGNLDVGTFTFDAATVTLSGAFSSQLNAGVFTSTGDISISADTIAAGGTTSGFNVSFNASTSFANTGPVTASGGFLTVVSPTLDIGATLNATTIRLEVVGNGLVIGGTAGVGETDITGTEFNNLNGDNLQFGGNQTGAIRLLLSISGDSLGISTIAFVSTGTFTSTAASLTGFRTIGFAVENFDISGTAFVGGDTIEFQQINAGTIDIGGVDGAGTLGISNTEFGLMSFFNLRFGRSTLNDAGTLVGVVLVNRNTEIFSSDFSFIEINATSLTTNNNLGADLALFINADEINFGPAPVYADYIRIAPLFRDTVQIGGTGTGNELLLTTASLNRVQAEELQIGTSQFDTGFEIFSGVTTNIIIADASGITSPRIDALLLSVGTGSISQTGALTVDKLLVVEAGNATLDHAGNQVGILAAGLVDGGGTRSTVFNLSYTAQSSVTVGDIVYVGIGDITSFTGLVGRGLNAGCTTCNLSVTLVTDAITIAQAIDVGSGSLSIMQRTAGTDIAIGGADGAGTLGIDAAELARINSVRFLSIGDADTGDISVTTSFSLNALACCSLGSLQFTSAGDFSTTAALAAGGRSLSISANNITIGNDAADTLSTATLTNGFSFARPTTSLDATGTLTVNAPIQSSGGLFITSGGAATFAQTIQTESGSISITAGGAVTVATVTVGSGSANISANGLLTVGGAMTATSSIRLSATDFAINANVTAPSLRLDAPSTAITVGGGGTLSSAELARLFGSTLVQIGDENTGDLTLASAISGASFGAIGNLALATGGQLDLDGNTLTSTGTLAISAAAATIDAAVTAGVLEIQHVTGGQLVIGGIDTGVLLGLDSGELGQLSTPVLRFGRNSVGSRAGITPGTVSVVAALTNAAGSVEINATDFSNSAAITAGTNLFINANSLGIGGALNADATTGTVRIAPRNVAFAVDIGSGSFGSGFQGFSQATLDLIHANTLEIGALNTSAFGQATTVGNINFSSAVNITTVNQLVLVQTNSSFSSFFVSQAAPITVNALAIRANGSITLLDAGNNVGTFAAQTSVFNSSIRFANVDGFAVGTVADGLGGSIIGVQSTSTSFGAADIVRLTAQTGDITLNSVVGAGFGGGEARLIATQGKVVQNASATVTARTLELDVRDSTTMTEANSVQLLAARVSGAGQNLTFTANSSVGTTVSTGGINGVIVPGNLVLRSNFGSISSSAAPFTITGTSRFEAPSGSVTLTNLSNSFGGLLSFQAFNVSVSAASGIALDTVTLSGSLTLNANGGITQAGAMVVNGSTSLTASNADIVLTNVGNNFGGAVSVVTANNVSLVDANAITLGNMTVGNALSVRALAGGINATGALVIGGNTTFQIDTAGNSVTANNAGNTFTGLINVLGSASNVTLRDSTTIDLGTVNASGNLVLNGPAMRGGQVITVGGTTTADPNCGCISFTNAANTFAGTFTTAIALDFLVQAATPINLADTQTLGDFTLANQGFTFGGNLTIDGRSLRLRTAGTTLTILPGAVITVAGGSDIVIEADFLSLGAPIIGPSTANLTIMPVSATQTIGVGTGAAGDLSIDNAELAFIEGRYRSITFGRPGQTGAINIAGGTFGQPVTFRANGPGGSIFLNGNLVGVGAGAFTFRGSGTTTHLFADIITAGTPIFIDDSVILHNSITLDSTSGGGAPAGANITITGATDSDTSRQSFNVIAGSGGVLLGGELGAVVGISSLNVFGGSISVASANTLSTSLSGSSISLTGTSYRTNGGHFDTTGPASASSLTIDTTDPDDDGDVTFGGSFSAASLTLILGSGNATGSAMSLGALSVSGLGGSADFTGTLNGRSTEVAARFVVRPDGADENYIFNTCIMSTSCGSLLTEMPIDISAPVDPSRFDPGGLYDGGGFYGGGEGGDDGPIGPGRPFISLAGIVVPNFAPKQDETTVQFSNQGNDELW